MRERPILFKGPLVRAILSGTKTVTRRIIKPQPWRVADGMAWDVGGSATHVSVGHDGPPPEFKCPHGEPGDRLYVREAWRTGSALDEYSPAEIRRRAIDAGYPKVWGPLKYEADGREVGLDCLNDFGGAWGRYRQGMHILREFSRIDLDILGVRAERVRDITDEDAKAEGVDASTVGPPLSPDQRLTCGARVGDAPHRAAFALLWDEINGRRDDAFTWMANPWVFRIEWPKYSAAGRDARDV